MAHARLTPPATARRRPRGGSRAGMLWAVLGSCVPLSCAKAVEPGPAAPPATAAQDDPTAPLPHYHSKRLRLSIPLPDGRAWRIDDHSQPELVATHAATNSRVVIAVFNAGELVGRAQCEDLARARKLVPTGDLRPLEDQMTFTQGTFDTRIEVALEPRGPSGGLRGHVLAFGGFLRKCYVFVYSTEVASAADESALASRLALVRSRVLGGLELDPFDSVARAPEGGPSTVGPSR